MTASIGIMIEAQEGLTWERWRGLVAGVEELGFASLRVSDHLQSLVGAEGRDSLSAWPALALAAEWTERIQIGPMVSPLTFYRPGVLARMARDVGRLAGGRLILGLGTGWHEPEHAAFGLPFPGLGQRFDDLEAGIARVRQVLGGDPLPILIGGGGERRTLPIAAREAAEWNLVGADAEAFAKKSARLDELCRAAGREPGEVRRSIMAGYLVGQDEIELRERAVRLAEVLPQFQGKPAAEVLASLRQRWLVGTPAQLGERMARLAEAGVQLFMLQHFLLDDAGALGQVAAEVMPALS